MNYGTCQLSHQMPFQLFKHWASGNDKATDSNATTLTEWEKELRSDERDLHKHGKVANVLRARSFYCLKNWRRTSTGLTRNCNRELRDGFKLTGYAAPSGIFKTDLNPDLFNK